MRRLRRDMHSDAAIGVFDLGGTWFRSGCFRSPRALTGCKRVPAVNYLSHPLLSAVDLQNALADFILSRIRELRDQRHEEIGAVGISIGAPVNANDMTVLGSGPLWGPAARPFRLHQQLQKSAPQFRWHVINDVTALLAPYVMERTRYAKTMLITVSSGIGSRLYEHRTRHIPYDSKYGVQGEIGHLVCPFELEGRRINRLCECGGRNHVNAFSSGRGIAQTLRELPSLASCYRDIFADSPDEWRESGDEYRLASFRHALERGNDGALTLLELFVTPLAHILATALTLDPEIDRIVVTGGVVHGLGKHYREALRRTFLREELYQITSADPDYLTGRLHWEEADVYAGLRGAGIYAAILDREDHDGLSH
jgi:2-epi-5-epi-valiolone 7-kinase